MEASLAASAQKGAWARESMAWAEKFGRRGGGGGGGGGGVGGVGRGRRPESSG